MDIQASSLAGQTAALFPTLRREHPADAVSAQTAPANANIRTALETLRARLAESGISLASQPDGDKFSPERVAERILDFVGRNVERAAPGDQARLIERARQAIDQGFNAARDTLQSLGVLKGDIAANIDDTYDRVMQGLDALSGSAPVANSVQSAITATRSATSQSGAVRIETQEGDIVTINFGRLSAQAQITTSNRTDTGSVSNSARASYQSQHFSYSVEGELSEAELADIEKLLKRTDAISERFFSGNVQAAFQQASALNISGDQIASFSLSLEHRSVQQAIGQYQSNQSGSSVPTGNAALADYAQQLRELMNNSGLSGLKNPNAVAAQLVDSTVTASVPESELDELQQGALNLLRDLLAAMQVATTPNAATPATVTTAVADPVAVAVTDNTATTQQTPLSTAESMLNAA